MSCARHDTLAGEEPVPAPAAAAAPRFVLPPLAAIRGVWIRWASPEEIRARSAGAVTNVDLYTVRDDDLATPSIRVEPARGGLLCPEIFGSLFVWQCACGAPAPPARGVPCPGCGRPAVPTPGRRDRRGHIDLAVPCAHPWAIDQRPGALADLLQLRDTDVAAAVQYTAAVVLAADADRQAELRAAAPDQGPDDPPGQALAALGARLAPGQVVAFEQARQLEATYPGLATFGAGAGALRQLLAGLDLPALAEALRGELVTTTGERRDAARRRLRLVTSLLRAGVRPEWLVLTRLPVLPPDLRPLREIDGRPYSSDLNELYRDVLTINQTVRALQEQPGVAAIVLRGWQQRLQGAVDRLLDNRATGRAPKQRHGRLYQGLSQGLRGKSGRFRRDLLGKRVDFSARSVIVAGPELGLGEVGLPPAIALELYRPATIRELVRAGEAASPRAADRMIDRAEPAVWPALERAMAGTLVLLNRAPTLHRLGMLAFAPRLAPGAAIRLPPLACRPFNADFDGDQMAVHLPVTPAAQAEARQRLWSVHHTLSPATGEPAMAPDQDMVMGLHYLTQEDPDPRAHGMGKTFASPEEAILAYEAGAVDLRAPITVRLPWAPDPDRPPIWTSRPTTAGRCLFNHGGQGSPGLPPGLRWRAGLTDGVLTRGTLARLVACARAEGGAELAVETLDRLARAGFSGATAAGRTFALADLTALATPAVRQRRDAAIAAAAAAVARLEDRERDGECTGDERAAAETGIWQALDRELAALTDELIHDPAHALHPIIGLIASGARGNADQLRRMLLAVGLLGGLPGILLPAVTSSWQAGLSGADFVQAARAARKAKVDQALSTAEGGYLTRRLVDLGQRAVVTLDDCGTTAGRWLGERDAAGALVTPLTGRLLAADDSGPALAALRAAGLLAGDGAAGAPLTTPLTAAQADCLARAPLPGVRVRSPLTCAAGEGLCRCCVGTDLATGELVAPGTPVGVIAAQSAGEPGTQMTLDAKHRGGAAGGGDDLTAIGLPRIGELLEVRRPRGGAALLAPAGGRVRLVTASADGGAMVCIEALDRAGGEAVRVALPAAARLTVADGALVRPGEPLTAGPCDPRELAELGGLAAALEYLVAEVQRVYRANAAAVDDRHLEILVRQLARTCAVTAAGTTDLVVGEHVSRRHLDEARAAASASGGTPPTGRPVLLGMTRAALASDSWLAAAAFQHATQVLTAAALAGAVDPLRGLKERVIFGQLVIAGERQAAGAPPRGTADAPPAAGDGRAPGPAALPAAGLPATTPPRRLSAAEVARRLAALS
ncbi:MAG: hypothetical protein IT340_22305 [Chloroflexi bacterium]|nr:hypothetical protein [Chloroflexota bacterium]